LEEMLKKTGADIVEGEAQYFAFMEPRFLEMDELEEILLNVSDKLGLTGGTVHRSESETYRVFDVTGPTLMEPEAHIVVQSNPGDTELNIAPQSYLLVVLSNCSLDNINTLASRLNVLLQPFAPGGQLSFYMTGELPDKMSKQEMNEVALQALEAVEGEIIEDLQEEEMLSFTVYTPLLEEYVSVDSDRFNLNLAIRYDDYRKCTVLLVGFPLIHASY